MRNLEWKDRLAEAPDPRAEWNAEQDLALSSITHDLRGPLCALMGYIDLAGKHMENAAPQKSAEYLSLARDAGDRLHQMVNEMMDMFRLKNEERGLKVENVAVGTLFDSVRKTYLGVAQLKKVNLLCEPAETAPLTVCGDARFLGRALDNLVINALKFTPPGGTVQLRAQSEPGRTVFEVADTGRGIPQADRVRIFEKFQCVSPADRKHGYGMGLALVKTIVQAHGGAVRVVSRVGKGSRFIFWIPNAPALQLS